MELLVVIEWLIFVYKENVIRFFLFWKKLLVKDSSSKI